jgi:hypothetical protein
MRGVEALDPVHAVVGELRERGERLGGVVDVPERMRPDGDAARGVDDLDRLGHRRPRARDVRARARHEVGREQLVLADDALLPQPRGVRGMGEHGVGQVRAADRLAGVAAGPAAAARSTTSAASRTPSE